MSSFKLPSFSFSGGSSKQDDQNGEEPEREGRKSRSLFSSLTGHSSSHSNGSSSASLRSPSPYAGRQRYKDGKDKDSSKHRHRPWKRHSRKESHSDIEYSGATSSANVSEAESDGEGALSRLASNSSTNTASSSNTAANTSGLAPLSSSTSSSTATSTVPSNTVSFADSPPKSARPARTRFTPASSGPQAGRGAPRNAYYDSDEENAGDQEHSDNDDDDENDAQTPTAATASVTPATADHNKATLPPESGRSASSAASSATSPKIRGIRTIDPLSDSDYEDPPHEEYSHTSDTDDGDEYYSNDDDDDMDPTVQANTEANAGSLTAAELLSSKPALLAGYGDDDPDAYYYNGEEDGPLENWPNLVKSPASPFAPLASTTSRPAAISRNAGTSLGAASSTLSSGNNIPPGTTRNGRGRGGTIKSEIPLVASRPVYERNRCTITLTHGDPDAYVQEPGNLSLLESGKSLSQVSAAKSGAKNTASSNRTADGARKKRKGKTYVVASDLSEESYYAIEWAIGTVLRSGDELLFVTVMETDSKREDINESLCARSERH